MWNVDLPAWERYNFGDPKLPEIVRSVQERGLVAIDTETTGLNIMSDRVLFWSLSWDEADTGKRRRLCMEAATLEYFRGVFADPTMRWIMANAKFDMHMIANGGHSVAGAILAGECVDVAVMHALLNEEKSHALKDMALDVLGWKWSDFFDTFRPQMVPDESKPPKKLKGGKLSQPTRKETVGEMLLRCNRDDPARLNDYASNDAFGTLQLYYALEKQLLSQKTYTLYPEWLPTMADLFFKTEVPFTKVLWKCERNGIFVNPEYMQERRVPMVETIARLERQMVAEAEKVAQEILGESFHSDGSPFRPNSLEDQKHFYFDILELRPLSFTSGGKSGVKNPSVDAKFLEHYAPETPMAKYDQERRKLTKLISTYIDGGAKHYDRNYRIHTRYNQDVARCMPAGELVLTSRGYLPVEKVKVGDFVIGHSGQPRKVVNLSVHAPTPIYRVHLANGLELRTNGEHMYHTPCSNESGLTRWTRAEDLTSGTPVAVHSAPEQWRPINHWPPFEVSSWGRVRNGRTGCIRETQPKGRWGHRKVTLYRHGAQTLGDNKRDFAVHRLVLRAFVGEDTRETRHLNGIAWDNTVENLCYGTSKENRQDALRHGTMSQRRAGRTKLTGADINKIRGTVRAEQPPSSTAKLTYGLAESIRDRATGRPGEAATLAKKYGVTTTAMYNLLRGITWPDEYGVSEGTIRGIQTGRRWPGEDYIEGAGASFSLSHVEWVRREPPKTVFGLEVEEDHSHVTGGIVTHNTGRLSSSEPNLQNIPKLEGDIHRLRGAFQATPGNVLIVGDYEQLEMRLLACGTVTKDNPEGAKDMIQIFLDGKDIHMGNAEMVYGPLIKQQYGWDLTYDFLKEAKKIDGQVKAGKLPPEALTERHHIALEKRNHIKAVGFG
jgi:DNA polymerase I-like protein with 3'-5' exonuclease and polymerase domains